MILGRTTNCLMPTTQIRRSAEYEAISFPMKLHVMLEDAETKGFQDIVSWQSGGKSFKVLNVARFSGEIMGLYFHQTKYKSFQRQQNIYGFRRIHSGACKGGYAHSSFIRGVPDICKLVIRLNNKATAPPTCMETQKVRPY
jgi:hypothetical protein